VQIASREYGTGGFDAGRFVADSVLIHECATNNLAGLDSLAELHCAMRKSRQPRRTAANFVAGRPEGAEAAGTNPEFALSDSQRRIRGDPAPGAKPSRMAAC
jgi:hypothetical protein